MRDGEHEHTVGVSMRGSVVNSVSIWGMSARAHRADGLVEPGRSQGEKGLSAGGIGDAASIGASLGVRSVRAQ